MDDQMDMDTAPQSAAERMPNELWDKVFGHLVPTEKDRASSIYLSYNITPKFLEPSFKRTLAGKLKLARNLRMTCKKFSYNPLLCDAAFYDLRIYVTMRSLGTLEKLSSHPILNKYVQRVVFVHPMVEERYTEPAAYIQALKDQEAGNERFPFSIGQLKSGHAAYCKAAEIQDFLLKYEYNTCVAECLQKLPNVSRIGIDAMEDDNRCDGKTWFQKHHPDVLLRAIGMDDEDHNAGNEFVYRVLEVLATARAQPEELIFLNGHGLGDNWDWSKAAVYPLAHLKVFGFRLRGAQSADEPSHPNWEQLLRPLQIEAKNLEALFVHIGFDILDYETSLDEVLQLRIPFLKCFHVDRYDISGGAF
ncbi:N-terminal kinase-like protein [Venturia inaequalis]|uniref:Uncharacterized protein n=1 Tax=Venturia inaequalis TaxID=5025 RepID=A0A8H3VMY1_VENIN|nr:hypothetical protein EG327_000819 [Venturia inaequalis]RDI82361.1 N-terminal kinase-like protein [Venturia inaequalis]